MMFLPNSPRDHIVPVAIEPLRVLKPPELTLSCRETNLCFLFLSSHPAFQGRREISYTQLFVLGNGTRVRSAIETMFWFK